MFDRINASDLNAMHALSAATNFTNVTSSSVWTTRRVPPASLGKSALHRPSFPKARQEKLPLAILLAVI